MKKTLFKTALGVCALVLVITACTKEKEYSDGFDISYPIPAITDFSPKEQFIDSSIIITGTNLEKASKVTVGANQGEAKIISKSATQVVAKLPRYITGAGVVTVFTSYKNEAVSKESFKPKYPDTRILSWPDKIIRGQTFFIKADNGDQITEIEFVGIGKKTADFKNGVKDGMNVFTEGLTLPDKVRLVVKAYGNVINGNSPEITVENYDPNASYTAVDPVLLWDFEDGKSPVVNSIAGAQAGINLNTAIPKGRGEKFLTVKNNNVANAWGDLQGEFSKENIDLNGFHEPYLTFMVNTGGKNGYVQCAIKQGAVESGFHFKPGNSDVESDDYNFKPTNGWEWRSINLSKIEYDNWGAGKLAFDPKKPIDKISFQFKQGNGGNAGKEFEINLDHIMITDGPRAKDAKLVNVWDFEDGQNPISATSPAATGINLGAVGAGQGDKFATVKTASIGSDWSWIASAEKATSINMSTWKQSYVSFWVNTGANKCYMQLGLKQGSSEFGFEISPDYEPQATVGKWKYYRIKLEKGAASRWSGTEDWNAKGTITNVKLGFTTGKVGAGSPYEINIDDINFSDGPAW